MKAKRKHLHPAWRKLRAQALYRDKGWCQVCDEREAVEVHHRSYRRGRGIKSLLVELDQLVSVCRRCHEAQHEWMRKGEAA
jgi:5-methylcytosine-specific restriction endonuclease McrA